MKCLVVALDKLFLIVPAWRRGKRAGLITPRSLDRNGLPVSFHFDSFKETARAEPPPWNRCSSAAERLQHRLLTF